MNHYTLRRLAVAVVLAVPGTALATTATVHKTPTCGCCAVYVDYLEAHGLEPEVIDHDSIAPMFQDADIDRTMASCHITKVGPYMVVGHMPVEAIERLLEERPMIRGIALPGMPVGSPGMPGVQQEPLTVYTITGGAGEPEVYGRF